VSQRCVCVCVCVRLCVPSFSSPKPTPTSPAVPLCCDHTATGPGRSRS
jgi:hypothetical protein